MIPFMSVVRGVWTTGVLTRTHCISNDLRVMESVGSRALSLFTPEGVHFDGYDANQLRSILRHRQDMSRNGVLEDDIIPLARRRNRTGSYCRPDTSLLSSARFGVPTAPPRRLSDVASEMNATSE